jgi:hypothetical protein
MLTVWVRFLVASTFSSISARDLKSVGIVLPYGFLVGEKEFVGSGSNG